MEYSHSFPNFTFKSNFFFLSNQSHSINSIQEENLFRESDAPPCEIWEQKLSSCWAERWLSGWHSLGHLPALHCKNPHFSPIKVPLRYERLRQRLGMSLSMHKHPWAFKPPRFVIMSCVRLSDWQLQVVTDESGPPMLMNRPLIAELLALWITASPA